VTQVRVLGGPLSHSVDLEELHKQPVAAMTVEPQRSLEVIPVRRLCAGTVQPHRRQH
jgi:hypothetical protein